MTPWYSPWGGYYGGGYYDGFSQGYDRGEVKVRGAPKDAVLLIDGAYAGEAGKRKSIWLEPGVYNLEVRAGEQSWQRRIYVLSGKTLNVRAELK